MRDEAYPWADGGHSTEREYLRSWRGMPLRSEWNASPSLLSCRICTSCGYRWDEIDFTYQGDVLVNGHPPPVAIHRVCWNCFMCEKQPHQVRAYWCATDRAKVSSKTASDEKTPKLQKLRGDQ